MIIDQNNPVEKSISMFKPVIKVIGLGGGGGNAVNRMVRSNFIEGIEFIAANTDSQALAENEAPVKILLGPNLTGGKGAGGRPEIGEKAAIESEYELFKALNGADIVFLTAGMGGGTGSGAISVAARVAQEMGAITISIVNTPFQFEAGKRIENARTYLSKLVAYSDTLIAIPNDQLLKVCARDVNISNAFEFADDVLRQGIFGISQLLTGTGEINVDFSHIRNMMLNGGGSLLSIGFGKGSDRVSKALYQALNHPLLEHLPIENATGIIANFTGGDDLCFNEVFEGMNYLQYITNNQAEIIPGQMTNPDMKDEVQVTLVITGMASTPLEKMNRSKIDTLNTPAILPKSEPIFSPVITEKKENPVKDVETDIFDQNEVQDEEDFEPVLAYSSPLVVPQKNTESVKLETKFEVSAAADAAYDTFMAPLKVTGTESASIEEESVDPQYDLDIPTFIRRKM